MSVFVAKTRSLVYKIKTSTGSEKVDVLICWSIVLTIAAEIKDNYRERFLPLLNPI
jgi:hypothetical protein